MTHAQPLQFETPADYFLCSLESDPPVQWLLWDTLETSGGPN